MKLLAFLKRDLLVTVSYRFRLFLRFGSMLLYLFVFYYVGRTFSGAITPYLQPYGGEYFPYVLVGVAVSSFVIVGLDSIADEVRSAQVQGTLESLLCTPTSIYTVLIGSSLYSFLTAFVSSILMIFAGAALLGLAVTLLQVVSILLVLLLTFTAFLCVGMLSASFIMIFKEGDPIGMIFGTTSYFLGGVFFPVDVLPRPFQIMAEFLPITHAIRAVRELLLAQAALRDIVPLVVSLAIFIAVLGPVSILVFHHSVKRAKVHGSLIQF